MPRKPSAETEPSQEADSVFVCIDLNLTGLPKFPSTAEGASKSYSEYLNRQHNEGLDLVAVIPYALGVELNRKMLVFRKVSHETSS